MKVALEVTAEHISKGSRCDSQNCPVALALRDKVDPAYVVAAGYSHIAIYQNKLEFSGSIPESVNDFIYDFDSNQLVQPFEFELDIPAHLLNS